MKKLFLLLVLFSSIAFSQTIRMSGDLIPDTTDRRNIGSELKLIRKGWMSEMQALLFAKNTITVHGGWDLITKDAGTLAADLTNLATTIDFGTSMTLNDFVIFRNAGAVEYVQVGSQVLGTRYNVTRNLDGSGANAWVRGTPWANLGYNGSGRIEMKAGSSAGDTRISMISQGTNYNSQSEYLRFGDLYGMPTCTTSTLGMFIGDASNYLKYDTTSHILKIRGSVEITGGDSYISVGGAAGDVNAGATRISGGLIELSSATTGALAGMTISTNRLTTSSGGYTTFLTSNHGATDTTFASGTTNAPEFWVSGAGVLHATGATISGDITLTNPAAVASALAFNMIGSGTTLPATRPDGSALKTGDIYLKSDEGYQQYYRTAGGTWDKLLLANMTLTSSKLTSTTGSNTSFISSASDTAFASGPTGAPTFMVTKAGVLSATGVNVTGTINVISGNAADTIDIVAYINRNSPTVNGNKITAKSITASQINVGSLVADSIKAGTFTGLTFQTSATGKRVVINSSNNSVEFYNASGTYTGAIYGEGTGISADNFYMSTNGSIFAANGGTPSLQFLSEVALPAHGVSTSTLSGLTTINRSWVLPDASGTLVVGTPWTSAGYLTAETDPNVSAWAKAATKPSYTYSEVGAASSGHTHDYSGVYEPVISKSAGYLTWTGSAWDWVTSVNAATLDSHAASYFAPAFSGVNTTIVVLKSGGGVYELTFTNGVCTDVNEP